MKKKNYYTVPRKKEKIPVYSKHNIIDDFIKEIQSNQEKNNFVILYDVHIQSYVDVLQKRLQCSAIAVPSGESSKSLDQVKRIVEDLNLKKANQDTILIVIGGGVLMDIGSFIASIFKNGIRYILIPTTLLAMNTMHICYKGCINIGKLKNSVSVHHIPHSIWIDTHFIRTLSAKDIRYGILESIRIAAVTNNELFGWIEENMNRLLSADTDALALCLEKIISSKSDTYESEASNQNSVSVLSFGHTIAHALESLSHFSISHGEALSVGMMVELRLANSPIVERMLQLLKKIDTPVYIPLTIRTQQIWDLLNTSHTESKPHAYIMAPMNIGTASIKEITFADLAEARE